VGRGFTDVDIKVNDRYSFTLLGAHLKSKRPVPGADEAELRLEEAKLLRAKVDAHLKANPNANLVVLGDFNDTYNTPAIKAIVGLGRGKLVDTRPAERNGDNLVHRDQFITPLKLCCQFYDTLNICKSHHRCRPHGNGVCIMEWPCIDWYQDINNTQIDP
jgi:hypothetical protein